MLQSSPWPLPPDTAPGLPVPIQSRPPVTPIRPPQLGAVKRSATRRAPPLLPVQVVSTREPGTAPAQALGLSPLADSGPAPRAMPSTVQPGQAASAPCTPSSQTPGTVGVSCVGPGADLRGCAETAHVVTGMTPHLQLWLPKSLLPSACSQCTCRTNPEKSRLAERADREPAWTPTTPQ